MTKTIVELQNVTKSYGPVVAVDNVNLAVSEGEFVVLLGPSGSGKTTILSMIGGFTVPTEGSITINGEDMTGRAPAFRPTVTVFQDYALFPHMTVFENVSFGLQMRKTGKAERQQRTKKSLDVVGLSGFGDRSVDQLSGGQRQRVALARAIAVEPAVLLLDEPLGALDLKIRQQMQGELVHLQNNIGATFVHVTHDQEEAMAIADSIVLINEGKVEDYGPPARVYLKPATLFAARFMGESNILFGDVESSESGFVVVNTGIGKLKVPGICEIGAKVSIAVRPEQLHPGTQTGEEIIDIGEVQVSEVTFQGTHRLCRVVPTTNQSDLSLLLRLPPEQRVKVGDVMPLYANRTQAVLLEK